MKNLIFAAVMMLMTPVAFALQLTAREGGCELNIEVQPSGDINLVFRGEAQGTPAIALIPPGYVPLREGVRFSGISSEETPTSVAYDNGVLKVDTTVYLIGEIYLELQIDPSLSNPGWARMTVGGNGPLKLFVTGDEYNCQF